MAKKKNTAVPFLTFLVRVRINLLYIRIVVLNRARGLLVGQHCLPPGRLPAVSSPSHHTASKKYHSHASLYSLQGYTVALWLNIDTVHCTSILVLRVMDGVVCFVDFQCKSVNIDVLS